MIDHSILALVIIGNIIVIIINIANIRLMRKMTRKHREQEARLRALQKMKVEIKTQGEGKPWLLPTEDIYAN